jgi:hypothetical protein
MENIENTKVKEYIIFSKKTGNIYGKISDESLLENIDRDSFDVKEVEFGSDEYYFGDFENGKLFNAVETPLVYESKLRDDLYVDILKEWPLYRQINAIVEVIDANKDLIKPDKYLAFTKFLKKAKFVLNNKIDILKKSNAFNFVSIEQQSAAYGKENNNI